MYYDWKKIFQKKTNKELYNIYTGKNRLDKEAVEFAKRELEKRDFDFDKKEQNYDNWRLSKLLRDQIDSKIFYGKALTFKQYLFIFAAFVIVLHIAIGIKEKSFDIYVEFIIISAIMVSIAAFFDLREKKNYDKRASEIEVLQKKLEKAKFFENESQNLKQDREREFKKYFTSLTSYFNLIWVLLFIALLIGLLKRTFS